MKLITIKFAGSVTESQVILYFSPTITSNRDWLVAVRAYAHEEELSSTELSWTYSTRADTNFTYLQKEAGADRVFLPVLKSTASFNKLEVELLPWSERARGQGAAPDVLACTYTASENILDNVGTVTIVGTIGYITEEIEDD